MPELDSLRCSDDDRRSVEHLLGTAYADGRLDKEEFDERSTRVWQARTFGELTPLTLDLVESEAPQPRTAGPSSTSNDSLPRAVVDRTRGDDSCDRILSVMSAHNRKDMGWRFKRRTNFLTVMGSAKLDLTNAVFEDDRCRIDVMMVMGSLDLLVPAGVSVVDKTLAIMGSTSQRGLLPESDGPVIEIVGVVIMGSVNIRGPESRAGRRALRQR